MSGTFAGGICFDFVDQGLSTFSGFGVISKHVHFDRPGNCWWIDFQAQTQTGSAEIRFWHAGGICFDFVDQGLTVFFDFRVISIETRFQLLGKLLVD